MKLNCVSSTLGKIFLNKKIEGYNNKLNNFLDSHPNIWKILIKIISKETPANLAFIRISNNTFKHRRRNKEDLDRDLKISKLKLKFIEKNRYRRANLAIISGRPRFIKRKK